MRKLKRALAAVPVSEGQQAMAWILFQANGLDCALEYLNGLEERGLLLWQVKPFSVERPRAVEPIVNYQQGRLF